MVLQDDAMMIQIMTEAFEITPEQITRLERFRARLTERPLGPEYATTEALRLSFCRHLVCTGRLDEWGTQ